MNNPESNFGENKDEIKNQAELLGKELVEKIEKYPISNWDKVNILLVMTGEMPASYLVSPYAIPKNLDKELRDEIEDYINRAVLLLDELGLLYSVNQDTRFKIKFITFGRDKESLERLINAKNHEEIGLALGYPKTAVQAFKKWDENEENARLIMNDKNLPEDVKKSDAFYFIRFKMSRDNWKEEIKTAEKWAKVVKNNSPIIFNGMVKDDKNSIEIGENK